MIPRSTSVTNISRSVVPTLPRTAGIARGRLMLWAVRYKWLARAPQRSAQQPTRTSGGAWARADELQFGRHGQRAPVPCARRVKALTEVCPTLRRREQDE